MYNRYPPYRRGGIRFFPHIIPIAFPLIFPFGIGLLFGLFKLVFPLIALVLFAGLIFFIVRLVMLGSAGAAWNSMRGTGTQWQQRFTAQQQQQPPYYQPQQPPYYQPSSPTEQPPTQAYGQGYQPEQPYYRPSEPTSSYEQPQAHYPEQMPPMEQ
jgi:predicted lipid-binding transport protein (Tim44 family)